MKTSLPFTSLLFLLVAAPHALSTNAAPKKPAVKEEPVITIGGQVRRPGPILVRAKMTLYQALQAGGGATEFGQVSRAKLTRNGKTQTIDLSKDENKVLPVKPDDTLEVPQKNLFGR